MSACICLNSILILALGQSPSLTQSEPNLVYVENTLNVRSGPSKELYRTSLLRAGDTISIRGQDGDWTAIAPPTGSFSWVNAKHVRRTSQQTGEIVADKVDIGIGTQVSAKLRSVVQTQLHKGDTIHILEQIADDKIAGEYWYKISPPQNEVRWVFGQFTKQARSTNPLRNHATHPSKRPQQSASTTTRYKNEGHGSRNSIRTVGLESDPMSPRNFIRQPAKATPHSASETNSLETADSAAEQPLPDTSQSVDSLIRTANDEFWKILRTGGDEKRDFSSVRTRLQQALTLSSSESERHYITQRLQAVQRQVSRTEDINRRLTQIQNQAQSDVSRSSINLEQNLKRVERGSRLNPSNEPPSEPPSRTGTSEPPWSGAGTLRHSNESIGQSTSYELVSPSGRIRYYLISTRVNLSQYMGQRIVVKGRKDRVGRLDAPTIEVDVVLTVELPPRLKKLRTDRARVRERIREKVGRQD